MRGVGPRASPFGPSDAGGNTRELGAISRDRRYAAADHDYQRLADELGAAIATLPGVLGRRGVSDCAVDFVARALALDATARPDVEALARHPWLAGQHLGAPVAPPAAIVSQDAPLPSLVSADDPPPSPTLLLDTPNASPAVVARRHILPDVVSKDPEGVVARVECLLRPPPAGG